MLLPGRDVGGETVHEGDGQSLHVAIFKGTGTLPVHHHPRCDETLIIVEGTGWLLVGAGSRREIAAGQVVHVPAGVTHGIQADPESGPLRLLSVFSPTFRDGDTVETEGPASLPMGVEPAPIVIDLERAAPPLDGATGIATREVARGANASVTITRARGRIPLHRHSRSAETAFIYEGRGLLRAGDRGGGETPFPVHAGAIFHFPRGIPHAFDPQAVLRYQVGEPPHETRLVSIHSPPYRPGDTAALRDPKFAEEPALLAVAPDAAPVGAEIRIKGRSFGADVARIRVSFGGQAALPSRVAGGSELFVTVPEGAKSGPLKVLVDGRPSNVVSFTVEAAR
jgi:quercetin dioxygenase-like cupin family protein